MPTEDRLRLVRDYYRAFASGDRDFIEKGFTDDFTFSSPSDVGLDRAGFFERCWPGAGRGGEFEFVRVVESGDEVIVTYESKSPDGARGRNTEILTLKGKQISGVEVYFGWNVQ
jgi:ketosteroid isomerase-like protein